MRGCRAPALAPPRVGGRAGVTRPQRLSHWSQRRRLLHRLPDTTGPAPPLLLSCAAAMARGEGRQRKSAVPCSMEEPRPCPATPSPELEPAAARPPRPLGHLVRSARRDLLARVVASPRLHSSLSSRPCYAVGREGRREAVGAAASPLRCGKL
jgi:hypothetical protein